MIEKTIKIFSTEEKLPGDERSVCAFDSSIEQWAEASYMSDPGEWIDPDGNAYWAGVITLWFDYPDGDSTIEYKEIA